MTSVNNERGRPTKVAWIVNGTFRKGSATYQITNKGAQWFGADNEKMGHSLGSGVEMARSQ